MAQRAAAADILSQADQQGMIFLKQLSIGGETVHKKGLIGGIAVTLRG